MSRLFVARRIRTMSSDGPADPTGVLVDDGRVTAVGDAQDGSLPPVSGFAGRAVRDHES